MLVANKKMADDVAYKITKAIFSNVKEGKYALVNIHPIAAQLTPANGVNSPIPLHPGAVKYFKEIKVTQVTTGCPVGSFSAGLSCL